MNNEFVPADLERYGVKDLDSLRTPRLLLYEWALLANRDRLKKMTDNYAGLRLMLKTFKSSAVLRMYTDDGLRTVKASGIGEARCAAERSEADDILVSFPCFGPEVERFLQLRSDFPGRSFSTIVGNIESASVLAGKRSEPVGIYIDVDPGMHRTGVPFGTRLVTLARQVADMPGLEIRGLHVYDGHVHYSNQAAVATHSRELMTAIDKAIASLSGICRIDEVVTGGALSAESNLRAHSAGGYEWRHTVSPGTSVLWDSNYNDLMPAAYDYAAAVATRVIDVVYTGGSHIVTTDCGLKFGSPTDPGPIHVTSFQGYTHYRSNERHGLFRWTGLDRRTGMPVETSLEHAIGRVVLAFPRHVCPTVNQYDWAYLIRDGAAAEQVEIDGRDG